jgi:DNA-binding winged helix-turn-helix (wHTH) protein/Tol biopolymer transport system component
MKTTIENEREPLVHFAGFTLDLLRRGLYQGPQRIHLTSKPLETLIYLIENRGRVIEKQELLDAVWKDTYVTEDTLVHAIREIRRALGDAKDDPRFVQTVPRRGYRFVCELATEVPAPLSSPSLTQPPEQTHSRRSRLRFLWIAVPVIVLAPILVWVLRGREVTKVQQAMGASGIKQITSGEFTSSKPAFSLDGRFMLYVSGSEETRGYGDLFVRQFPEGTPLRITNKINPSGDLPVFTSDGSHVVFSLPRIGGDNARHHDLWIVPSFGGPPSRFVENASGAGFSPDGNWVAYTKHSPLGNALWVSSMSSQEEHFEVSAEGYTPRWSGNGEWLAYSTGDPNHGEGDIWTCRITKSPEGLPVVGDHRQITHEKKQLYGLTWASDSRSIIFASARAGSMQLYSVSIADGSILPLLSGIGDYGAPSASAEGRSVVFQHFRLVNDLMVSTPGGTDVKNLTYGEDRRWPRISPSGETLVSVLRSVDDSERIYLTDLRTRISSQLSDRPARHPCWLDDENAAFLSIDPASQNTEVIVVNTVTREFRLLTRFEGEVNWLAIHPDKKRIAVVSKHDGKERIVLRNLEGPTDQIIQEGAEYEYLRWSPDGSYLCWDRPGTSRNAPHVSGGIWMFEIGTSEARLIAKDGYCPVWSKDGASIYYAVRRAPQGLRRHDIATRKEQLVSSWDTVFNYDIFGDRLVFTQHRNDSQVYSISLSP